MNQETHKLINSKMETAEKLCDQAITPICEAASLAILDRNFTYAHTLISKAERADNARAECANRLPLNPNEKNFDGKK